MIFHDHPRAQSIYGNIGLLLPALTFCAVVIRRRREWAGAQRLFWDAFLIGMILWSLGHVGWAFTDLVEKRPEWIQWHTMFSLSGGIGPLVALIARPHRGVRRDAVGATAVDLISYGMLVAFIYAYFVLVPSMVTTTAHAEVMLLSLVQLYRFVLLLALAASAWAARRTPWFAVFASMTAGVAAGFFLRVATSRAILSGVYHSGSAFDLAWIVPYLAYSWAALTAPASPPAEETRLEKTVDEPSGLLSALPMLLVPILGYGLLRVEPLGNTGDSFRVLLTTMTTVAGVGLLTVRLAVQRDELHRADARLRLLAAAVEQTRDLILITRPDGSFVHANDACVRALGFSHAELSRMTLDDLFVGAPDGSISAEVRRNGVWRGTLVHRRRDGSTFPVSSTVVGLRDTGGSVTHFVGVQRDITDELRLRDQLVQSERMSAMGELVAGVAHEINNPLQTIVGCVELLLDERGTGADRLRDLQLVRREAARAGQIVRNLLAFVRRGSPERALGSLNQIVKATTDLREFHLAQNTIRLTVDLHPSPLHVNMNREEIQQVVLNLLLNAEQAILRGPGRGTIAIRTTTDGVFHRLQVTDDGPGVSPELRGRIFEPFFTTKDVGDGTGLGLSISLGIATGHGGALALCETARGACFELRLPAAAAPAPAPSPSIPPRDGSDAARVLIVEDEAPIRSLLTRLLARRGLRSVEAASVAEALGHIESGSFGLVLCDVALGDDSGVAVYRHAQTHRPDLVPRFAFVTGDAGSLPRDPDLAGVPVLSKPFTAADLDRVISASDSRPSTPAASQRG